MKITENIALAPYTTFKIGGPAKFFCAAKSENELLEAVSFAKERKLKFFVLGGGSNILISDDGFNGLIVKNEIMGVKVIGGERGVSNIFRAEAGAGEIWDGFVAWSVGNNLYGLENLSSIPGTVGAAPVQNIGAYGSEVAEIVGSVRALDASNMVFADLSNEQCRFGYRDSVFKREKGRYIITKVCFNLKRDGQVNIKYKDLNDYFSGQKIPTLKEVRDAVMKIRARKLPDWKEWGTAGSFFKNPVILPEEFRALRERYPGLPGFPEDDGKIKVSLGWVLDIICGAKGLCKGKVCVYEKQALVLVASSGATAEEVVALSRELMKRVKDRTNIEIEAEVEWVN